MTSAAPACARCVHAEIKAFQFQLSYLSLLCRKWVYRLRLGRVDKLNPDSDAGKQHEGGEALDQLVVAGGDTA